MRSVGVSRGASVRFFIGINCGNPNSSKLAQILGFRYVEVEVGVDSSPVLLARDALAQAPLSQLNPIQMATNEAQEVIDLTEDEAAPWLMQPPVLMRSPALQRLRAEHERRLTEADRYKNHLMTASVWLERIQELVQNEEEGAEACAKLRKMLSDQMEVFTNHE